MAPTEDLRYGLSLSGVDPASLTRALGTAAAELGRRPGTLARAFGRLSLDQLEVAFGAARAALGGTEGAPSAAAGDRRFDDRAWSENAFLRWLVESYLVSVRSAHETLDSLELQPVTHRKARFALGLVLDALSPSNVPWLNPAVVKEAYDTGGLSVVRGAGQFVDDLVRNGGQPRQVDTSGFELGRNLAATPGRVVFQNELLELLAYEPVAERVYAQPFLYVPPWINKYYLLDMAPGRSFVEHAVAQGFTVVAISWRNPDETMSELMLDDYLRDGLLEALGQTSQLTGSETVNIVSVCVGGTLTAIALAALAARGEQARVGWAAMLNSLVDFAEPGEIAAFADEETIERIEQRVKGRGFMEPEEISGPFTLMKGNDLIWRYVVSNWQMGKQPPAFDLLAWNADAPRLPASMHVQYLRACYLHNLLVEHGELVLDGVPIDVARIKSPLYVLGSREDHIVPWQSAYRTTQLTGGKARFVLTSGGHIAGLVNPPGKAKARLWTQESCPPEADTWLEEAEERAGSWWDDWASWAAIRSGELVEPPTLPEGEPAPGTYVRI